MLFNFLLILGVGLLSLSLRSFAHPFLQKLGTIGVVATSFLCGWLLTGLWTIGLFCALSWFLFPWIEILTRVRRLRIPTDKTLRLKTAPDEESFPPLSGLTEEIEAEDFALIEDCGWDWEDYQQFFRLFYCAKERTQCAICVIEQQGIIFYYLSVSSRGKDGRIWTTWNYPFSYSLKLVPEWEINRLRGDQSFFELYQSHLDFLAAHGVGAESLEEIDPEQIQESIQNDLHAQIKHNLAAGVLRLTSSGQARYSWRGLLFIWMQFLRDLVRFS